MSHHFFTHFWSFQLFVVSLVLCGCTHVNQNKISTNQFIPFIELSQKYPNRELIMDEVERVYISLETTADILSDQDFSLEYLSDKRLVGIFHG